MPLENLTLTETHNLPIRHEGEVHSGKVRSVYWLFSEDSKRLVEERGYNVATLNDRTQLGVMVISDRISAFNVNWNAEDGLKGVPGKGASLNAISEYWFKRFEEEGIGGNHIVDSPYPLVWIVQKAKPIRIEAIARQYITGSMWRDYSEKGVRNFCGIKLPEGLTKNQRLTELLLTPTTKGMLGILGLPEGDDANLTREQILEFHKQLGFSYGGDVAVYERMLREGFGLIASDLTRIRQLFVDTKFEFGYVPTKNNGQKLIFIDEVGTLDSSRFWPKDQYDENPLTVTEESKEGFRQFLIRKFGKKLMTSDEPDVIAGKKRIAKEYRVPVEEFMKVSATYCGMCEKITGRKVPEIRDARGEILDSLASYGIVA